MLFYSSTNQIQNIPLKQAIYHGFSEDGGLYIPQSLPHFSLDQLKKLRGLSFLELSKEIGKELFREEMTPEEIEKVFEAAFNFPTPFLSFGDKIHMIELFHGPTLSFKDFGARFMAALLKYWRREDKETVVLVATSGDTGSAVGQAFADIDGVRVYILYPKGLVTPFQEKQLTTIGRNVTAVEIKGTFENCQELLKKACLDPELKQKYNVTTANSINVARLFPQSLYYFYAYNQLPQHGSPVIFSVPCGNFGHLVSGIFAKRMGLPISRFLGVTNINDEIPLFLKTGIFQPHTAYQTIAVSMDVGDPSNFPRLLKLYNNSLEAMRRDLLGISLKDEPVKLAIVEMYANQGYLLDPHSAFAYLALRDYLLDEKSADPGIFFATAHPAKFLDTLKPLVSTKVDIPQSLKEALAKPKHSIEITASFPLFKELIYETALV